MLVRSSGLMRLAWIVFSLGVQIASGQQGAPPPFKADTIAGQPVPWTAVPQIDGLDYRFTVFGDRTGMAYPGAMERAIGYVNGRVARGDHAASFVLSVGDNIEGYSRDAAEVSSMWEGFDAILKPLRVPLLRLPGNHDISDAVMERVYTQRYGRPYYAFQLGAVLFLMMDTEDGPPVLAAEREVEIHRLLRKAAAEGAMHPEKQVELPGQKDPCDAEATHTELGPLAETHISAAQLEYFRRALVTHKDAAQVVVLMHRPPWRSPVSPAFAEMQRMLRGRKYTVFAGHYHQYSHEVIEGADYYILGPTAALPRCLKDQNFLNQVIEVQVQGDRLITERVMLNEKATGDAVPHSRESSK